LLAGHWLLVIKKKILIYLFHYWWHIQIQSAYTYKQLSSSFFFSYAFANSCCSNYFIFTVVSLFCFFFFVLVLCSITLALSLSLLWMLLSVWSKWKRVTDTEYIDIDRNNIIFIYIYDHTYVKEMWVGFWSAIK
jgi:hypothetical protein